MYLFSHFFLLHQQASAVFFTKEMCDLSVRLFGKAAIKETGVLPVVRILGLRALRASLALIFESID